MYRTLLVPLDGTLFGEHALAAALAVARRTRARIRLVHVHVRAPAAYEGDAVPGFNEEELTLQADHAYIERVLARMARLSGLPVEARLLGGPVAQTLATAAREAGIDLVVMSTHGRAGFPRLWHRGVAAYLSRHLSLPLLMVHAGEGRALPEHEPDLQHLLLPLSGSAYSEQVLEHAVRLGEAFGARYTLLKVVQPRGEYTVLGTDARGGPFPLEERCEQAAGYLAGVAARLRARGLDVETAVIAGNSPARAISAFVSENRRADSRVDLIALETHGLGGAAHLFTAGVAEQVVHDSSVPVLVHHSLGETVRVPAASPTHERALRLAPGPAAA